MTTLTVKLSSNEKTKLEKIAEIARSCTIVIHPCSNVASMARPKSIDPTAKQSRTVVLGVRFSARQLRELRKAAKSRGITVTELVRRSALQAPSKKRAA
jgi:predicted transcriptional regulator